MAVLTSNQVLMVFSEGRSDKAALYALRNVTSADTADVSQEFTNVKRAVMLGTTVSGTAVASVSGTVVTVPAGLSGDAAYLLVWGCAN